MKKSITALTLGMALTLLTALAAAPATAQETAAEPAVVVSQAAGEPLVLERDAPFLVDGKRECIVLNRTAARKAPGVPDHVEFPFVTSGSHCFGSCDCSSCDCSSGCSLSECRGGCDGCWGELDEGGSCEAN